MPAPVVNLLGFCVLVTVLGAATLRNRHPLDARQPGWVVRTLFPASLLMALGAAFAGLAVEVVSGVPRFWLVALSLAMVAVWARSRRRGPVAR